MANDYFSRGTFQFLEELETNNNRDWFNKNKQRYEDIVRGPALDFIADFGPSLEKIAPHFLAIPKKSGGSLMRIYKDIRFSKDKTPYKTNIGIHFRHEQGKDVHTPGYYIHIDTKECFLGAGIWRPQSDAIKKIRQSIDENNKLWLKTRDNKLFRSVWELSGDTLTNPPRGYHKENPMIEDLKRKDFIAVRKINRNDLYSESFIDQVTGHFKKSQPLMQFLCHSLEVGF